MTPVREDDDLGWDDFRREVDYLIGKGIRCLRLRLR